MEPIKKFHTAKALPEIGIIIGWASVCTKGGKDYVDEQGDIVTEDAILEAAAEFAKSERIGKVSHQGETVGSIDFLLPLTADIAKSLGIECDQTGLVIGFRPNDDTILKAVEDGTLTGFSIGGWIAASEVV